MATSKSEVSNGPKRFLDPQTEDVFRLSAPIYVEEALKQLGVFKDEPETVQETLEVSISELKKVAAWLRRIVEQLPEYKRIELRSLAASPSQTALDLQNLLDALQLIWKEAEADVES